MNVTRSSMWLDAPCDRPFPQESAAEQILRPSAQSLFPLCGTAAEGMALFGYNVFHSQANHVAPSVELSSALLPGYNRAHDRARQAAGDAGRDRYHHRLGSALGRPFRPAAWPVAGRFLLSRQAYIDLFSSGDLDCPEYHPVLDLVAP